VIFVQRREDAGEQKANRKGGVVTEHRGWFPDHKEARKAGKKAPAHTRSRGRRGKESKSLAGEGPKRKKEQRSQKRGGKERISARQRGDRNRKKTGGESYEFKSSIYNNVLRRVEMQKTFPSISSSRMKRGEKRAKNRLPIT